MSATSIRDLRSNAEEKDDDVLVSSGHSERMLSLLESGVGDLIILAGKHKAPIRVQKMFLTAASPVFRKMFSTTGNNYSRGSDKDGFVPTLELPEMSKEEVMMFLKFLYAGTLDKVESAVPLLRAATTYEIPDLGRRCAELLETKVSDESVLCIYDQARIFNNTHLMKTSLQYICKNAVRIVELPQFQDVSVEGLAQILEEDALAVYDEVQLFDAMMRWGRAEVERQRESITPSNIRLVLGNLIRLIRFPQMTECQFACKAITSQILSTDEIVAASLYYNVPDYVRSYLPPALFNSASRHYIKPNLTWRAHTMSRKHTVLISDEVIQNPVFVNDHSCAIRFRVNTQIWIRCIHVDFTFTPPTKEEHCSDYLPKHLVSGNLGMNRFPNYSFRHEHKVFPFNPTDVLQIVIEDNPLTQVLAQKSVCFSKPEPTKTSSSRCILTVPLDTDLRIPKNTQLCATFRVSSRMLRNRRLGGSADQTVISVPFTGANGQKENVVFVFEETEYKPFFVGFSFDFVVN